MKVCLPLLIILFSSLNAISQAPLSVNSFLATSRTQKEMLHQEKIVQFLQRTAYQMPWIEQVELRTRTHDFEISQQEYIFRVTPNSPRQRWAQKKYHNSTIRTGEMEQQFILGEALLDRYEIVAGLYFCERLIRVKKEFFLVYEDKIHTLKKSALLSNFDITDLIKTEDDRNDLQMELLNLENTRSGLQTLVKLISGSEDSLDLNQDHFIGLEEIKNILPELYGFPLEQHPLLARQSARIEMLQYEYNVEDAERRNVLDYVESRYEGQRKDFLRERLSIGFGFKLPLKGSSKLKLNNLKLEQLEAENKQEALSYDLQMKKEEYISKMQALLDEHALLLKQLETSQARFSMDQYPGLADATAYTLLKIRESLLEKELDIVKKEQEIFEFYLELLHLSGIVAEQPLRNYLSAGLEAF